MQEADRPRPLNFAIIQISNLYVILGVMVLIVCIYFLFRPTVGRVLILFSAAVLSPSFLIPLGGMAWTPYAERYLYLPAATFSIAVTILVCKMPFPSMSAVPKKLLTVSVFLLFSGMAYATTERNFIWQDNLTLFQDTLAKSPGFAPVRNELATALQNHGRLEEARKIFASNSLPATEKYHIISDINMARAMASQGNPEGARKLLFSKTYDKSISFYKDYPNAIIAFDGMIIAKSDNGRLKAELYNEIIAMIKELHDCTGDPFYYYRAGQQYLALKRVSEAKRYFRLAYEQAPEDAYYRTAAKKLSVE